MSRRFELLEFESDRAMAEQAARQWLEQIAADGCQSKLVALSGGRAAIPLFQEIAWQTQTMQSVSSNTILSPVHFFWVDERCVSAEDDQSNYLLADRFLFKPLHIQKDRIHRIRGELEPSESASAARAELISIAPKTADGIPILDWVFLGMGEDGHIGSLFPNLSEEALASMPLYQHVVASKPPPNRIALSLAALVQARNAWIFIVGPGKDPALADSLSPNGITPLARLLRNRERTGYCTTIWKQSNRKQH